MKFLLIDLGTHSYDTKIEISSILELKVTNSEFHVQAVTELQIDTLIPIFFQEIVSFITIITSSKPNC